jgi:hypothetical protein
VTRTLVDIVSKNLVTFATCKGIFSHSKHS